MPAYVIATMNVHDPETYRRYTALTPPTVKKHGGRFLTRGDPVIAAEGPAFNDRMVILEFPSAKHAQAWLADPDYVAALKFKHAASVGRVWIQEGRANTETPDPLV